METHKILNFLNSSENEYSEIATKKCYVIDSETKRNQSYENLINQILNKLIRIKSL